MTTKLESPEKQHEQPEDPHEDYWKHRSKHMTCSTCMYYVPKIRLARSPLGSSGSVGRCRRHSPTMSGWPALKPQDFCGDHKIDEEKV